MILYIFKYFMFYFVFLYIKCYIIFYLYFYHIYALKYNKYFILTFLKNILPLNFYYNSIRSVN